MSNAISNARNYVEERTKKELERASKLLEVYAILKDGKLAGRITARKTKSGAVHVAFYMYSMYATKGVNGQPVYGYMQMTGSDYNKVSAGIAANLAGNKKELLESYNVDISKYEDEDARWSIEATWMHTFADAGFIVIKVL